MLLHRFTVENLRRKKAKPKSSENGILKMKMLSDDKEWTGVRESENYTSAGSVDW